MEKVWDNAAAQVRTSGCVEDPPGFRRVWSTLGRVEVGLGLRLISHDHEPAEAAMAVFVSERLLDDFESIRCSDLLEVAEGVCALGRLRRLPQDLRDPRNGLARRI